MQFLEKLWKNVRKHWVIKLVTTKARKNYLALEPNNKIIHQKRIQSIDSIETYAYGTNKEIIHRKEEMKYSNIIKQC